MHINELLFIARQYQNEKNIVLYLKRMFIFKVFNIDWQIDKPVLQMNGSFFVEKHEMRLD